MAVRGLRGVVACDPAYRIVRGLNPARKPPPAPRCSIATRQIRLSRFSHSWRSLRHAAPEPAPRSLLIPSSPADLPRSGRSPFARVSGVPNPEAGLSAPAQTPPTTDGAFDSFPRQRANPASVRARSRAPHQSCVSFQFPNRTSGDSRPPLRSSRLRRRSLHAPQGTAPGLASFGTAAPSHAYGCQSKPFRIRGLPKRAPVRAAA